MSLKQIMTEVMYVFTLRSVTSRGILVVYVGNKLQFMTSYGSERL